MSQPNQQPQQGQQPQGQQSPGRMAFEAFRDATGGNLGGLQLGDWDKADPTLKQGFEAAVQAVQQPQTAQPQQAQAGQRGQR
jgi:hypothetical protein